MKTKITPCFWFDDQAEEAARFYTGVFPNSQITAISRYPQDHYGNLSGWADQGRRIKISFEGRDQNAETPRSQRTSRRKMESLSWNKGCFFRFQFQNLTTSALFSANFASLRFAEIFL
jgi:hypothetical protein